MVFIFNTPPVLTCSPRCGMYVFAFVCFCYYNIVFLFVSTAVVVAPATKHKLCDPLSAMLLACCCCSKKRQTICCPGIYPRYQVLFGFPDADINSCPPAVFESSELVCGGCVLLPCSCVFCVVFASHRAFFPNTPVVRNLGVTDVVGCVCSSHYTVLCTIHTTSSVVTKHETDNAAQHVSRRPDNATPAQHVAKRLDMQRQRTGYGRRNIHNAANQTSAGTST